jgi:hypothetical protein
MTFRHFASGTASLAFLFVVAAGCASASSADDGDPTTEGDEADTALTSVHIVQPNLSADERAAVLARYAFVDSGRVVPRGLLEDAIVVFDANRQTLHNTAHLVVVDFARHSSQKRFFVVDTQGGGGGVSSYVVAHGSGSDPGYTGIPTLFSNVPNSNMSSLGFYVTGDSYDGKHGHSLRLDGVSTTDSNVRSRGIVVHGASYVEEGRSKQGRSWGCFALPESEKDHVIDVLQGGALMYAGRSSA